MLGLTHPGQVETNLLGLIQDVGPDPVTQLEPHWCHWKLLGTAPGSFLLGLPSAGPGWVEQLWRFLQMPVLGPSSAVPAGSAGPWSSRGVVLWCSSFLQGWWQFGSWECALGDPEVSLVTGTTCSRQHRTRDPKSTSHSLPELSSAWF